MLTILLLTTLLLPSNFEKNGVIYSVDPSYAHYVYADKAVFQGKPSLKDGSEEDAYFKEKERRAMQIFKKEEILAMVKPPEPKEVVKQEVKTTVYFDFDSYRLKPEEKKKLTEILPQLKKAEVVEIKVSGYTDKIGTKQYNDALALKRAEAVKTFLISQGVSEKKIKVSGQGKCCYVSDKDSENRRVEVVAK